MATLFRLSYLPHLAEHFLGLLLVYLLHELFGRLHGQRHKLVLLSLKEKKETVLNPGRLSTVIGTKLRRTVFLGLDEAFSIFTVALAYNYDYSHVSIGNAVIKGISKMPACTA